MTICDISAFEALTAADFSIALKAEYEHGRMEGCLNVVYSSFHLEDITYDRGCVYRCGREHAELIARSYIWGYINGQRAARAYPDTYDGTELYAEAARCADELDAVRAAIASRR